MSEIMSGPLAYPDNWTRNDEGTPVPHRTSGSVATGWAKSDFGLVCHFCGDDYSNELDLPIGVVAAHFKQHHPDELKENGEPNYMLDMLWLGKGPSPRTAP